MLTLFRSFMKSLIFRIVLFGLLLASFALWGVSDTLVGGALNQNEMARVGDVVLSYEEFRKDYYARRDQLSKLGLSSEQINNYGLHYVVLSSQIERLTWLAESRRLGLQPSQQEVNQAIVTNPSFQGPDGAFSAPIMQRVLQYNRVNVEGYYQIVVKDLQAEKLHKALFEGHEPAETIMEEGYRFVTEIRDVDYISLAIDSRKVRENPDESTLLAFYDENGSDFEEPEQRAIEFISVKLSDIAKRVKPSQQEIADYYEENQTQFITPEKRAYGFIRFNSEEDSLSFHQKLREGSDFTQLAKQQGHNIITQPVREQGEIPDASLAQAVFALKKKNDYSQPVKGIAGHYIIRLTALEQRKQEPLSAVRTALEQEVARDKAFSQYAALLSQAEDLRISGRDLSSIAESLDVPIAKTGLIFQNGTNRGGKKASDLPHPNVLQQAFALAEDETSYPHEIEQQSFYMLHLAETIPAFIPKYSEIAESVKQAWLQSEKRNHAHEQLQNLQKQIMQGDGNMQQLAGNQGYALLKRKKISRTDKIWPAHVMNGIFAISKEGELYLDEDEKQILLFQLAKIAQNADIPRKDDQDYQQFAQNFTQQYRLALQSLFQTELQKRHKVIINDESLQQFVNQTNAEN